VPVARPVPQVRRVRFSPHEPSLLLSSSYDMGVCLWDVAQPQPLLRRRGAARHGAPPCGRRSMRTPRCEGLPLSRLWCDRYDHHTEFVVGVEFSLFQPGLVASCGWDNLLYCWHQAGEPPMPAGPRGAPGGPPPPGGAAPGGPPGGAAPGGSGPAGPA